MFSLIIKARGLLCSITKYSFLWCRLSMQHHVIMAINFNLLSGLFYENLGLPRDDKPAKTHWGQIIIKSDPVSQLRELAPVLFCSGAGFAFHCRILDQCSRLADTDSATAGKDNPRWSRVTDDGLKIRKEKRKYYKIKTKHFILLKKIC